MNITQYETSYADWIYGGVDPNMEGNGGPECAAFLSPFRRICETILAVAVASIAIAVGMRSVTIPSVEDKQQRCDDSTGKKALLAMFCLVFGIEIGFKFATKSLIFLLNPCHVTTALQVYLMVAEPSPRVTAIFRVQIYLLNGAVLALLFPVTNTRFLPFENDVYWIQHFGMLVVPYYLLRSGGVYSVEEFGDFSWSALSYGINLVYHFVVLQGVGMSTQVNLNSMLCPAISDPFYGPNYRVAAILHQLLAVPLVGKLFIASASYFIYACPLTRVKGTAELKRKLRNSRKVWSL